VFLLIASRRPLTFGQIEADARGCAQNLIREITMLALDCRNEGDDGFDEKKRNFECCEHVVALLLAGAWTSLDALVFG
jgi:hypothetical protein